MLKSIDFPTARGFSAKLVIAKKVLHEMTGYANNIHSNIYQGIVGTILIQRMDKIALVRSGNVMGRR